MIEKKLRINALMDYYITLLTDKQQEYLSDYYQADLSLGEIAEQHNLSRQAIFESIRRAETLLETYEDKLKLYEKAQKRFLLLEKLRNECLDHTKKKQIYEILDEIENLEEGRGK